MKKTNNVIKDLKITPGIRASELVEQFADTGFQASELASAARVMKQIFSDRECTVFLAFTANLVASGLRGVIADAVNRGLVHAVITTGGSIDHDVIKSYAPYEKGDFFMDDVELHKHSINRLGNILVPNARYELLEQKIQPILRKAYLQKKTWGASDLIHEIGLTLKDENSFLRACARKNVPVFSPGLIDSALGLQMYFFKQDARDFVLDETADFKKMSRLVFDAKKTGGIVLGGGISKHFTIGSNLLRGGLDYGVYFTTAEAFDGSLSGARTQEAKSWGKIKEKANAITVNGDATVFFPLAYAAAVKK